MPVAAASPQTAAISRRYPGILQERSEGSVRLYSTRAANAARRHSILRTNAARRCISHRQVALITNYLGRRKATHTPDNSAPPGGGNIAPLSGDFASEKRGECTTVLDPSGERRKVRGSKRDCRRYMMPAFSAATRTDQKSLVKMVSIPALKRSATSAGSSQ